MSGENLDRSVDRRTVLGAAALVVAGAGVSACASGTTTDAPAASTAKATAIGAAAAPAPAAGGVGKDTDVPVGAGKVFNEVVVTQPAAGTFKAFSAICTHQGCTVSEVTASGISCPCHGSVFSISDGSVVQGPATKPLTAMKVTADNGTLTVS